MGKAGNNQKGQSISDGVNTKKKGGLSAARMKKLKEGALLAKQKEAMDAVNQMKTIAGSMGIKPDDLPTPDIPNHSSPANDPDDSDDSKSAYQMLQDMRWVYRNVSGRKKLKTMMADDKQFQFLVKELMKIETSLMAAKVRAQGQRGGDGNSNGFFVILKGLEDDKAVIAQLAKQRGESKTIDLAQIDHAMNPEATFEFEEERKVEELEGPEGW